MKIDFATKALINGEWIESPNKVEIDVTNPATLETIAKVPDLGIDETNQAINAAFNSFDSWSELLARERSKILRNWFELIMSKKTKLATILTMEQGKPLQEALGEIDYAASFIEFFAEEAKRINGEILQSHKSSARTLVFREPLGVIGVLTPWNFPAAMITRKVAPLLAAGCTTVIKPASETPLSAIYLAKLGIEAGLPNGVINLITTSNASDVGKTLCQSDKVKGISFTGSTKVGKILMEQSSSTLKKMSLELGGNAAFIVCDDADLDKAVEGLMASKFRNMGQTCVCANRILVHEAIHDKFLELLIERVKQLKLGNGLDEGVTQGALIHKKAVEKMKNHINDAISNGAKLVLGGNEKKINGLDGYFFEPTILTNVDKKSLCFAEETFAPLVPIYKFKSDDEALTIANDTPYGLSNYFYTQNLKRAFDFSKKLQSGIIGVNEGIISTELAPFGGVNQSGMGREGSHHAIDEYTELKYVLMGGIN